MIVDLIRIGHAPEDPLSLRRMKSMSAVIFFVIMCMTLAFFWNRTGLSFTARWISSCWAF